MSTALSELRDAAIRLPLAVLLGSLLALRPRRRGTPPRRAAVVQTQIILALIGSLVMIPPIWSSFALVSRLQRTIVPSNPLPRYGRCTIFFK